MTYEVTMQFEVGNLVKNNSGGPKKDVCGIDANGHVRCKWTDDSGTPHEESYPPETLKLVEDRPQHDRPRQSTYPTTRRRGSAWSA